MALLGRSPDLSKRRLQNTILPKSCKLLSFSPGFCVVSAMCVVRFGEDFLGDNIFDVIFAGEAFLGEANSSVSAVFRSLLDKYTSH